MKQQFINLYDEYTHGTMSRRVFLKRLSQATGGVAAAGMLLPLLENNYAKAAIVSEDDERIKTTRISYPAGDETISGYLSLPEGKNGPLPSVMVIHENRGLNPHIEDVARRFAVEGFIALAPDLLSTLGGTPTDMDGARYMITQLDSDETITRLVAGVDFLKTQKRSNENVGAVGFCWGGGMTNNLAVASPDLKAGVPYYGRQPSAEDVPKIKASLMLHYAGKDQRINAGISNYEKALKANGIQYQLFMYQEAQHAFNNDTNETRYNKAAATLAWERTVGFFRDKLS